MNTDKKIEYAKKILGKMAPGVSYNETDAGNSERIDLFVKSILSSSRTSSDEIQSPCPSGLIEDMNIIPEEEIPVIAICDEIKEIESTDNDGGIVEEKKPKYELRKNNSKTPKKVVKATSVDYKIDHVKKPKPPRFIGLSSKNKEEQ